MITVRATITGPWSDYDDLVNDAREAVAQAGYQVGDFQETGPIENAPLGDAGCSTLSGNLEVDDRLFNYLLSLRSGCTKVHYGYVAVELEVR